MPASDDLLAILDRIVNHQYTDADLEALREALTVNSAQNVVQIGKYTVNIGQGQDIRIGDQTIYQGADAETIREVFRSVLQEMQISGQPPATPPPLSLEEQKEAVCQFLQDIEDNFKYIRLFHTQQPIVLKEQYIPIQVTLERKYKHEVETTWAYAEDENELKRVYALKKVDEESRQTQVDWEAAKKQHQNFMVLADPGMGKSTLLRMEAGTTAYGERQKLLDKEITLEDVGFPLFLRLSELDEQADEILNAIPKLIKRDYPKTYLGIEQLLNEKLSNGKCILLLDALDEVSKSRRIDLAEKLNRFARNYPCQILCTSRIVGYGGAFIEGAKEVEIVPFSQKQTEEYIKIWFKNAAGYIEADSISAEGLIQELRNKPQIGGLAQNPLLLALLCSLYQEKGVTLPARRGQVYTKVVEYMLGKWGIDNRRQSPDEARVSAKKQLLEELAYQFSCQGKEIFSMDELTSLIEKYLRSKHVLSDFRNLSTSLLIGELSEQDCILQKLARNGDNYLFLHRTFQEYLTASYLKKASDGIALAREHFWEYDWHETLSLLAGLMENPLPLLKAINDEKDDIFKTLLLLAGRSIAECQENSHPLIAEIIDRIYKFWQSYPNAGFIELIVVALGKVNSQMFQRLPAALNHSDEDVRWQAVEALGEVGNPQAVDALIAALNHSDSDVRWQAATALGKIGSSQAIDALSAALYHADTIAISHLPSVLSKIGNPQAMDALISALNDSNSELRNFAVWALGEMGNPQATNALISALKDSSSEVRSKAAFALARICNPQAVDALISALNDDVDYHVRTQAAWTLSTIGNSQALDALIATLKHPDFYLRVQAALALTEMNYLQGLEVLNAALNQSVDYLLRLRVIGALGMMRSPQAVNVLIAALKHSDGFVRRNAAEALGRKGNPQGIEILIAVLNYSEGRRTQEIYDLSKINNSHAVEALIAALNHSDSDVRWDVAEVLAKMGNSQGVNFLITALDHLDSKVRRKAAWILAEIGNAQGEDVLIDALNDSDSFFTESVAKVLGKISTSETLAKLIQLPELDIYDPAIFSLARTLAVRFSKEKLPFIPVYPELVRLDSHPYWQL